MFFFLVTCFCGLCGHRLLVSAMMTPFLIYTRWAMIAWLALAIMPFETMFDAVEAELEQRGVPL